jgi:hypothetical protein
MTSYFVRVDQDGPTTVAARAIPVYREDYRPRLIGGRLANLLLRRVGEFSRNTVVFPYLGQGWEDAAPAFEEREVQVNVTIASATAPAVLDLREPGLGASDESLSFIQAGAPLSAGLGRDLMWHGDFEDYDTDDAQLEAARWDVTGGSRFVCLTGAYRGVAGLCSSRSANSGTDSVTAYRNSVRVLGDATMDPNKDLSLVGYVRGQNAGPIQIVARYLTSEGGFQVGADESVFGQPAGTSDWHRFVTNLHMPADTTSDINLSPTQNARAVRVFLHHGAPASGAGIANFDEIAVVAWEGTDSHDLSPIDLSPPGGVALKTPHARDFVRISGAAGTYPLTLRFRRYLPAAVAP